MTVTQRLLRPLNKTMYTDDMIEEVKGSTATNTATAVVAVPSTTERDAEESTLDTMEDKTKHQEPSSYNSEHFGSD